MKRYLIWLSGIGITIFLFIVLIYLFIAITPQGDESLVFTCPRQGPVFSDIPNPPSQYCGLTQAGYVLSIGISILMGALFIYLKNKKLSKL